MNNTGSIKIRIFFLLLFTIPTIFINSDLEAIERRRSQFQREFGYIITPVPFILPGVGSGIGLLTGLNNIYEYPTDLFLVLVKGDVEGTILGTTDIHIVSETLLLDLTSVRFNKGKQNRYLKRGMASEKEEYNIVELEDTELNGGRLTLTLFERRFEIYSIIYEVKFRVNAILDNKGELKSEIKDQERSKFRSETFGINLDYTDDRGDPREGVKLQLERSESIPPDENAVRYFVTNVGATLYLPVFDYSTLAFNFFKSDAHVYKEGETDPESLKSEFGCDEESVDQCDSAVREIIDDQISQNKFGNASSLGGRSRLRSFNLDRFTAARSEFFGAEMRWNLTNENTPFDILFIRDFRTGLQVAFFYEIGTVADKTADLWKEHRYSVGTGFRMVTGSGFVYRFDVAYGDEGTAVTLFIDYPWGNL